MSSAKWLAQYVSPEASYTRRYSLNQIELLEQIVKLRSRSSCESHRSAADVCNLSEAEDCKELKYESCQKSTENTPCASSKLLQQRRASCDPCFMPTFSKPSRDRASLLRRTSLAAMTIQSGGSSLLLDSSRAKRRSSFCTSSPRLLATAERSDHLFRIPSLSPCVEDELREDRFLFSSCTTPSSYPSSTSSCSPFLYNESLSNVYKEPKLDLKNNEENKTIHFDAMKRKHSVPLIRVDHASSSEFPCSSGSNCQDANTVHKGFSIWLVDHMQKCPSSGKVDPGKKSSVSLRTSLDKKVNRTNFPHRSSYTCQRRVSLQTSPQCNLPAIRKSSLHIPNLKPPTIGSSYHQKLGTSSARLRTVIGRGGFGTVHIGKYKGKLVAVKKITSQKVQSCSASELSSLGLPLHPHLLSTILVVTANPQTGKAVMHHRHDHPSAIDQMEISIRSAGSEFGLSTPCRKRLRSNYVKSPDEFECSSLMKKIKQFPEEKSAAGSDLDWMWVVSELCTTTTLLSIVHSTAELNIKQKLRFLGELASGLTFLHEQGFIHRDVKPANSFLTQSGAIKLGDYGCCGDLKNSLAPVIGTIAYQAPEILQGSVGDISSDVYSFGVTAWHVLNREVPYKGLHPHIIAYNVTRIGLRPDTPWPRRKEEPEQYQDLLEIMLATLARKCWQGVPGQRPTASSVCRSLAILYLSPERVEVAC